ncbi:MAG: peptide ligase PGM1-related protein [Terrabacter sp.]
MGTFEQLQQGLGAAWAARHGRRDGCETGHVLVVMPSFSVQGQLLQHYGARFGSMEHRYLLLALAARDPRCEVVYVSSLAPGPGVLDYYASLLAPAERAGFLERLHVVTVADPSWRPTAAKLLDDPAAVERVRAAVRGRPAMLEVWNVTATEEAAALALGVPIDGTPARLRALGFKSAGRRLFHAAGIDAPVGCEDVRGLDEVARAVEDIRRRRPGTERVVVKLDDSGAGDGNVTVGVRDGQGSDLAGGRLLQALTQALSPAYLAELAAGGVVEELVVGDEVTSPSGQADIGPDGSVTVASTHEQVLGGPGGQVYSGCILPSEPVYAVRIARATASVAERLAALGARGRVGVDFVARREGDRWSVLALEVNLRNGGTTHPLAGLAALVRGRYDAAGGCWVTPDGEQRCYCSTDNIVDAHWLGLDPLRVVAAVRGAGIGFDVATGTGVVLQMLSGLSVDGRIGLTAIAPTTAAARQLAERGGAVIGACVTTGPQGRRREPAN